MKEIEAEAMDIVLYHFNGNVTKSTAAMGMASQLFTKR